MEAARAKAASVAAQEDVPMGSRIREIEKLYAKARASNGPGKKGKKAGGGRGAQKKGPALDKRMKKDKRGMDRAAKRMKGRGRKGGKAGGRGRK
jgi:AdoMet-dependent rRNA methyltransferase SPB1